MNLRRWVLELIAGDRYLISDMENSKELAIASQVSSDESLEDMERTIQLRFPSYYLPNEAVKNFRSKTDAISQILQLSMSDGAEIFATNFEVKDKDKFAENNYYGVFRFRVRGSLVQIRKLKERLTTISDNIEVN